MNGNLSLSLDFVPPPRSERLYRYCGSFVATKGRKSAAEHALMFARDFLPKDSCSVFHERARFLPPVLPRGSHRGRILSRIFLARAVPRLREVSRVRQTHSVLLLGRLSAVSPCFLPSLRNVKSGVRSPSPLRVLSSSSSPRPD